MKIHSKQKEALKQKKDLKLLLDSSLFKQRRLLVAEVRMLLIDKFKVDYF